MTVQYCEQLAAIGHFEPWNAVSNIAFVIAGIAGWRQARRMQVRLDPSIGALILIALMIGIGSFAWHATHQPWAELADVIPILGFVLLFWFLALHRALQLRRFPALVATLGMFAAIALVIVLAPTALNGSAAYLPVLVGLFILAVLLPIDAMRIRLRLAASCFAVSLVARTIDNAVCTEFPLGTHWLWHLLNGAVIYLSLVALIDVQQGFKSPSP